MKIIIFVKGVHTTYTCNTFPILKLRGIVCSDSLLTKQGKEIHEYAMEGKDLKTKMIKKKRKTVPTLKTKGKVKGVAKTSTNEDVLIQGGIGPTRS